MLKTSPEDPKKVATTSSTVTGQSSSAGACLEDACQEQDLPELIWVTPKWPLPAEDGARRATCALVGALAARGVRIHLIAYAGRGERPDLAAAIAALGLRSAELVSRRSTNLLARLFRFLIHPSRPVTIAPYLNVEARQRIEHKCASLARPLVVFDGLHAAASFVQTRETTVPYVYRAHNVEGDLWLQARTNDRNFLKRVLFGVQARAVRRVEFGVVRNALAVFPVSELDAVRFRKLCPGARVTAIPIGVRACGRESCVSPNERRLLFVGRLDWPPNRKGLGWFLERVWPEAIRRAPDLRLTVAGSGDSRWLGRFRDLPGITVLGRVPDVVPHYGRAIACIVPVFFGSGTRVKAIEAVLFGRACISTELGVEGIGFVPGLSYLRAESEAEWIAAIMDLAPGAAAEIGARAFEWVSERFDPAAIAAKCDSELHRIFPELA